MTQYELVDHAKKSMIYMLTHDISETSLVSHLDKYILKLNLDELICYSCAVGLTCLFLTFGERHHMYPYIETAKIYLACNQSRCRTSYQGFGAESVQFRNQQMSIFSLNLLPIDRPDLFPVLSLPSLPSPEISEVDSRIDCVECRDIRWS